MNVHSGQHMHGNPDRPAVAIVGYGTAGVNALIALRAHGYEGPVRVFSDTATLPYSPLLTSYYAGGRKTRGECFPWSAEELDELGAQVLCSCPVLGLDADAHTLRTAQGTFAYSKCIIATGATPQSLGFPATQSYEPLMLRTLDDAERLKAALENPACRRVLISGASMVALKMLEACLDHQLDCTLVGMNPHVLDFNALPPAAQRFEAGLRAQGVSLRLGQTIQDVQPEGDGPRKRLRVTFSNGQHDVFDEICVAHGMKCNLDFVPAGALAMDRAILTDEFMRTSDPDIYAAGDIVQGLELTSEQRRIVGIWKNAALQGAVAGAAIAAELAGGQPDAAQAFPGSIPSNTIAVNQTLFISAGTMEVTPDRRVEVRETDDMTVVLIWQDCPDGATKLLGFNIACDHDQPGGPAYDLGAMLTMRIERACGLVPAL